MKNDSQRSHLFVDQRQLVTITNSSMKQKDDVSTYLPKVRIQKKPKLKQGKVVELITPEQSNRNSYSPEQEIAT